MEKNNLKKNTKILSVLKKPNADPYYISNHLSSNLSSKSNKNYSTTINPFSSSIKVNDFDSRKDKDYNYSYNDNDYDYDKFRNKKIEIIKPFGKNISIIKKVMKRC